MAEKKMIKGRGATQETVVVLMIQIGGIRRGNLDQGPRRENIVKIIKKGKGAGVMIATTTSDDVDLIFFN